MRRYLIIVLLALAVTSCGNIGTTLALYSDGGCTVYRSRGDNTVMIRVSYSDLIRLEQLSGMDGRDALSVLFGISDDSITEVDWDAYFERRNLLVLLAKETHSPSPEMALWKNAEDLENTAFLDTINELSSSFDVSLIASFATGRGSFSEYRLGDILFPASSWEGAQEFIRRWMDTALEADYEG